MRTTAALSFILAGTAALAPGHGSAAEVRFGKVILRASELVPASDWQAEISGGGEVVLKAGYSPEARWRVPASTVDDLEVQLLRSGILGLPGGLPEHWGEEPGWCLITVELPDRVVSHAIEPHAAAHLGPSEKRAVRAAAQAWRAVRRLAGLTELPDAGCSRVFE